jgi:hypothetical protein
MINQPTHNRSRTSIGINCRVQRLPTDVIAITFSHIDPSSLSSPPDVLLPLIVIEKKKKKIII